LARWQAWARDCVTSPLGFLLTGLIALVIAACTGSWGLHCPPAKLSWTLLYGAGPLAAGYLLWEVALHSAKVQTLSILAAATPVLATLLLCCFLGTAPGWEVATAACLVSLGVVLSLRD
jgi:drug/metabolite transporter (DMT)-like permease